MAVELACGPNLPIHRNPIFLFANITFCPSAPNCSHSVSNVPFHLQCREQPSRSEVRLCLMLMDRVELCAGSPQMGPRSSFGSAFGPLERVPKMSSLTLLILVCERNFVFGSYGFCEIFERQPNAFFLPRPEVGRLGGRLLPWAASGL